MDSGQTVYILSQLVLGAIAAFLAIMLWSRTRNLAWMFIVVGTIFAYVEIVYSILQMFGISINIWIMGSVPLISFILPSLRMFFFIAAFLIMIIRHSRQK
jgi:hypothetical protein